MKTILHIKYCDQQSNTMLRVYLTEIESLKMFLLKFIFKNNKKEIALMKILAFFKQLFSNIIVFASVLFIVSFYKLT